ncbi:MAG: hypothetical protein WAK01_14770 [Methylocystis sp.]
MIEARAARLTLDDVSALYVETASARGKITAGDDPGGRDAAVWI